MFTYTFLFLTAGLFLISLYHLVFLFLNQNQLFKKWLKTSYPNLMGLIFIFHLLTALILTTEVKDVALFASTGYMLAHKLDIYLLDASHGTYPFWPFTIYPYALFWWLTTKIPFLTFSFWVKCLLIPIMFLTGKLIAKINQQPQSQLLLVTNPLLFLTITFHGQADILLIYFFLLNVWFLVQPTGGRRRGTPMAGVPAVGGHGAKAPDRTRRLPLSGLLMAFSVMTKTWSVMFLPLILLYLKSLKKMIVYLSIFLLTILAFGQLYQFFVYTSFSRLFQTVLSHPSGASGSWGFTALLPPNLSLIYNQYRFSILILGLLGGLILLHFKKPPLLRQFKIFILIVYVLTAGWGLQYTAWLVPFALLDQDWQRLRLYTLLALPYLTLAYLNIAADWKTVFLDNLTLKLSFLPWLFCFYWLFLELKAVYLWKSEGRKS